MESRLVKPAVLLTSILLLSACGHKGSSVESSIGGAQSTTTVAAFDVAQNPATVAAGGSITITPSGGAAPYSFALQTDSAGTLSSANGSSASLLASPAGLMTTIVITDSAGRSVTYSVRPTMPLSTTSATSASPSEITIAQNPSTVGAGGSMMITPSGGTPPYTFDLQAGSAGELSQGSGLATTLTASSQGFISTIVVGDSAGQNVTYSVVPTTTVLASAGCSGTYAMDLEGSSAQLVLLADASGDFLGQLTLGNSTVALKGACGEGLISFKNLFSGSAYVGSYKITSSGIIMNGTMTDVDGDVDSWSAR